MKYFVLFKGDELLTATVEMGDPRSLSECEKLLSDGWREVSKEWFDFVMEFGYEEE